MSDNISREDVVDRLRKAFAASKWDMQLMAEAVTEIETLRRALVKLLDALDEAKDAL